MRIVVRVHCVLAHEIKKGRLLLQSKGFGGSLVKRYRDIEFKLEILLGSADLKFYATYKDGVVAEIPAKYREDADEGDGHSD